MSPRPNVTSERKQQIYQAALACFARKGFHLTTMDDIAEECGLSKGSLYWYFDSKKSLFLSLMQETMDQFGRSWEAIISDEGGSATEKLQSSLAFFRSELADLVPFFGILMEAWALTRHDEDVESLTREFYQPYLDTMTQLIEEGIKEGEFVTESAGATALVVMTLFDGVMLALGTGLATQEWDQLMDAAESLVLRGLGAKRSHGSGRSHHPG